MDTKDNTITVKRLSTDATFYNNVFKKSEKISSVVLYLLSFLEDDKKDSLLKKSLEEKSFKLHELSLNALQAQHGDQAPLWDLRHGLVSVMSSLEVATAARLIHADAVSAILEQIDAVQRHLHNHYLQDDGISIDSLQNMTIDTAPQSAAPSVAKSRPAATPRAQRQRRVSVPAGDISSDAYMVYSQLTDRADRIKTVLEAKPQATVKDVAEIVTDVSEKTIQRELNSLIEKGQVLREGERRWSRYSVVKD